MSKAVDLNQLEAEISGRPTGYLLTTGIDGRPHCTSASFTVSAGADNGAPQLTCGAGNKTSANVGATPQVSVLWPPATPGGYSLIVDGDAAILGAEDTRSAVITATHAILHRTVGDGSGNDCASLPD